MCKREELKFPIHTGIVPSKLFLNKLRPSSELKLHIEEGISPTKLFSEIENQCNEGGGVGIRPG